MNDFGGEIVKRIYMDNNATTAVRPEVLDAMLPFYREQFGNPSSVHWAGRAVSGAVEKAREQVAQLINCSPAEIVFVSCGSEGDNMALKGTVDALRDKGDHIITTTVEHPAVLETCKALEKQGVRVTYLPVDHNGMLNLAELEAAITDKTILISVMWANNETGNLYPIEEIGAIARKYKVRFHTDAVQAVGKVPIDLQNSSIHMLSLSGHKLHAPKGVGVLYLRRGTRFRPLLRGGHQERGRRAGTENAASIVGLGVAAERALQFMDHENSEVKRLRDKLEAGILAAVPYAFVTGDPGNRLPNTANIAFEYIEGEAILLLLNKVGIAASSGSACTSGSLEPSHVMRAMDIPYTAAHGTVRFSLSRYTTEAEIDHVIREVPPIVAQLRKLSPYWNGDGPVEDPGKAFAPVYA